MELRQFLEKHGPVIREKWYHSILDTYPAETSAFLRKKKDRFENPVGHVINEMVDSVLECLLSGHDSGELASRLRPMVQLRAVQNVSPSRAVSFVLLLKRAAREASGEAAAEAGGRQALAGLDAAVDEMALASFDIYMQCREKISEIRHDEMKRNLFMLLRNSGSVELRGPEDAQGFHTEEGVSNL